MRIQTVIAATLAAATLTLAPVAAGAADTFTNSDYAGGTRQPCEFEDSTDCVWDARHMGNGVGRSFVVREYRSGPFDLFALTTVTYVSHARAHCLLTGRGC